MFWEESARESGVDQLERLLLLLVRTVVEVAFSRRSIVQSANSRMRPIVSTGRPQFGVRGAEHIIDRMDVGEFSEIVEQEVKNATDVH